MNISDNHSQQVVENSVAPSEGQGFYTTPELSQRLDLIQHLIDNSDLVPLVRGEVGAGRSTAIHQLQAQMSENWLFCRIDANPMLHPDQLMVRLARFFGIAEADDNIRDRLIHHFEAIRDEGGLAVIAVDDAEQLPPASLIALLHLHEQRLGSVPIVALALFALPTIEHTLATPQLRVMNLQLFHIMDLPRISREQATGYMRHLLALEELPDQLTITEPKLDTLLRMSEGLPGKLTTLILQSIDEDVSADAVPNRYSFAKIAALTGIGLIVLVLLFQDRVNQFFQPEVTPNQQSLELPDQKVRPEPKRADELTQDQAPPTASEEPPAESAEEPGDAVPETEPVAAEVEPVTLPTEDHSMEIPPEESDSQQPLEKDLLIVEEDSAPEEKPHETPVDENKEVQALPPAPEPKEAAPQVISDPDIKQAGLERDAWILTQRPTDFTLQLIGVSMLEPLQRFIRQHDLQGEVFYIKTTRKGRPWYVLLSGVYPSREKAKAAIPHDVPQTLQKKGVWARSFESLQQEIKDR